MFWQSKLQENSTNQESEDIHSSENYDRCRESQTFALQSSRVCSQLGLNQERISSPKSYTKEVLPVDSLEVATAQKTFTISTLSC